MWMWELCESSLLSVSYPQEDTRLHTLTKGNGIPELLFFPLGLPVESRQFSDCWFWSRCRDLELDQVTAFMIKLASFLILKAPMIKTA